MSDLNPVLPLFISTFSTRYGPGNSSLMGSTSFSASITWPLANMAIYVPIFLPFNYPVKRVFWCNGSSVTSTNMDFGIYTASGTKLYSTTSTAQSGASLPQYVTPTEFVLTPGAYYFALSCSSTTASRGGQGVTTSTVARLAMRGFLQENSALPLPATMTPITVANSAYPYCGITRTSSGFA